MLSSCYVVEDEDCAFTWFERSNARRASRFQDHTGPLYWLERKTSRLGMGATFPVHDFEQTDIVVLGFKSSSFELYTVAATRKVSFWNLQQFVSLSCWYIVFEVSWSSRPVNISICISKSARII